MARYLGPKCKLSRREGVDLSLKSGIKPLDVKARKSPPGGQKRGGGSRKVDYLEHLREKQKLRRIYGILERQFRNYYHRAERMRGETGLNLIHILESRLDNVVFRLGFAVTRAQARQMVSHKMVLVDESLVNIPSCRLKLGQKITLRERSLALQTVKDAIDLAQMRPLPEWLNIDFEKMEGVYLNHPSRQAAAPDINENLIVEYYSK